MQAIVMSTTYGEREAETTLANAWEILGGLPCDGLCGYVEDIENFASVFYTAKRTGGDMGNVIQKVSRMLGDRIDVKKEIEATLAAKKSEQLIMSLMPVGIIFYLNLTSPGFLDVLYGNPFGICAMSVCLAIYSGACWMGRKIVDIEV